MTTPEPTRKRWTSFAPISLKLDTVPGSLPAPILSYRHDWEISDQVTVTIGGNLYASNDALKPYMGVNLRSNQQAGVSPTPTVGDWALEISTQEAVVLTPDIDLAKPLVSLLNRNRASEEDKKFSLSLPINGRIGTEWGQGGKENQHVVDIGVKNKYVIGMVLLSSLIAQNPSSVRVKKKEVTAVKFNVGGSIPIGLGVVVDCNLSREGRRLVVSFSDLPTPIIRTSERAGAKQD